MASSVVVAAVKARVLANWTRAPLIDFNVQGYTPPDGSAFLVVQYPIANNEQITIGTPGSQLWRETGMIRFVLSLRRTVGLTEGLGWMDELISVFRGQKFSSVNTWAPSSPHLDDSNDLGNYWILASVVPYYFDVLA